MRCRRKKSLAKAFDPSKRAAARVGPKHARPAALKRSTMPATKGPSGPTMVSAMSSRAANSSKASISSAAMSTLLDFGSIAVPALPGATNTCRTRGDAAHFQVSACSRPPPPTINIFMEARALTGLMPEVAYPGEHHGDAVFVGRADHFGIALRASGLNHGLDPELGDDVQSVAKREERVGRHRRRFQRQAFVPGLQSGDLAADYAAHLPGAYPQRRLVLGANDGIGFDIFRDAPGKQQIIEFRRVWRASRDHAQVLGAQRGSIDGLHQQAAGNAPIFEQPRNRLADLADFEHADVVLDREQGARGGRHRGRKNHLDDLPLQDRAHRGGIQFTIDRNDAAE